MISENTKKYYSLIKKISIFILLVLWFIIPVLKGIKGISLITLLNEYKFMQVIGLVGIYFLIFYIYKSYSKEKDKKMYTKEIIPIIILVLYMTWTLISSLCSENLNNAFYGVTYRKDGYITYLIYAGFFSCAFLIKSNKLKKVLLNILVLAAISNIISIELVRHGISSNIFICNRISTGVFKNSNHYGYYLLLVTMTSNMLFITEKNKIIKMLYLISYCFLLYYLILNDTLGCYIAMTVSLILFLIYSLYNKNKIYLSIISIIAFIIMSFCVNTEQGNIAFKNIRNLYNELASFANITVSDRYDIEKINQIENAGSGRIRLWKYGIKFFMERPILGYGPENLGVKYAEEGINQDRPHNLIIQLATTSGVPGMFLYLIAVGLILKRAIKNSNIESDIQLISLFVIGAYLISAMFGNSMYYTSPYFFIFLGFLMYENINKEKELKN